MGAVASLTYSWALDVDALGIRVNAVCPVAHTRMVWKSERSLRATPPERTPSQCEAGEGCTVREEQRKHLIGPSGSWRWHDWKEVQIKVGTHSRPCCLAGEGNKLPS